MILLITPFFGIILPNVEQGVNYSMIFSFIDHKSDLLDAVQHLGDSASATVGFLAQDVYADYARKGNILVATDNDQLLGYIMFRFRKSAIIIVQLCVQPQFRGQGIPSQMLSYLMKENRDVISHIQLACRRDYGLEKFWQKLGFSPVNEKAGRATTSRTILTIWSKPNPDCVDLFSSMSNMEAGKSLVVMDTNVIIDLCQGNQAETSKLSQDYLRAYVEFRISKYVLDELNFNNDEATRNRNREYAKANYAILDGIDDELSNKVTADLVNRREAVEYSNTWYDIQHIAQAIAAGADIFVTRDDAWLNNTYSEYLYKTYNIQTMSPAEFITHIEELNSPSDYAPVNLSGLDLKHSKIQSADISMAVNVFFSQVGTKKAPFEKMMHQWLSQPDIYSVYLVKMDSRPACLYTWRKDGASVIIDMLLVNRKAFVPSLCTTFIKRIAFGLLGNAYRAEARGLYINCNHITPLIREAFHDCGFFDNDGKLVRLITPHVCDISMLQLFPGFDSDFPINKAITTLKADCEDNASRQMQYVLLEKALWPLKLSDANIPCFIVPIKPEYAIQLFDEELYNQELSLFCNDKVEPALSIENVYYKTAVQSIKEAPARILWYESSSNYIGTPAIRACSYLDHVETGSAKELFKQYQRLGVLDWESLNRIGNSNLAAYVFSYTELLRSPVGLKRAREIIKRPTETFQSFRSISEEDFFSIYKEGMG